MTIDLEQLMAQVLARLVVASDLPSAPIGAEPKGESDRLPVPPALDFLVRISGTDGHEARPARGWRWYERKFNQASSDETRRWLIREAIDELSSLRYSARLKIDVETRDGRLQVGRDKRPATAVASSYGYSVRQVRRLRAIARDEDARIARDREVFQGLLDRLYRGVVG